MGPASAMSTPLCVADVLNKGLVILLAAPSSCGDHPTGFSSTFATARAGAAPALTSTQMPARLMPLAFWESQERRGET